MLGGLNHITLSVSDLDRSFVFYTELLDFQPRARWVHGAYLSAQNLWLCLSQGVTQPATDYTHIAFSISREQFKVYSERFTNSDVGLWQPNSSEGDSLYFLDPDGHKLEVHVGDLQSRLASLQLEPYDGLTLF